MATSFVVYEKATGRVECLYSCPEGHVEASFMAVINGNVARYSYVMNRAIDPHAEYINVDSLARENLPRQPFDLTITGNVVSGLPESTEILFLTDRTRGAMDDSGTLEIEVDYAQTIRLRLDHPHYLTQEIAVECAP